MDKRKSPQKKKHIKTSKQQKSREDVKWWSIWDIKTTAIYSVSINIKEENLFGDKDLHNFSSLILLHLLWNVEENLYWTFKKLGLSWNQMAGTTFFSLKLNYKYIWYKSNATSKKSIWLWAVSDCLASLISSFMSQNQLMRIFS